MSIKVSPNFLHIFLGDVVNDNYKKEIDKEMWHSRWCRFKVFLWAFTPGWIAIIMLIGYLVMK